MSTAAQIPWEILTRFGGDVKGVVIFLGGKRLAPRMDGDRRVEAFGKRHGFPDIERLEHMARVGVPMDVEPAGDLEKEIAYGNHFNVGNLEE